VVFKGETIPGEQPAIIERKLFDAVQAKLDRQVRSHRQGRTRCVAILTSRLFDDHGQRMTPTHSRKGAAKYRYYISSTLVQVDAVGFEPVSSVKFPANREINREFFNFGRDRRSEVVIRPMIQRTWSEIPYSTEQGIFVKEQGICTQEQGI